MKLVESKNEYEQYSSFHLMQFPLPRSMRNESNLISRMVFWNIINGYKHEIGCALSIFFNAREFRFQLYLLSFGFTERQAPYQLFEEPRSTVGRQGREVKDLGVQFLEFEV